MRKVKKLGATGWLVGNRIHSAVRPAVEQIEGRLLFSGGQVDLSFGNGGIVTLPSVAGSFRDVKSLPDGRLLAVGVATGANGQPALLTARFTYTGDLDPTFGVKGIILTQYGGLGGGDRIAMLPGGKFYVAGNTLARFNANGFLDTTFGTNGIVHFNDGSSGTRAGLAVQADGKIVISHGVDTFPGGDYRGVTWPGAEVSRYNSNGSPDLSFGTGGRVTAFAAGTAWDRVLPADVTMQGNQILIGTGLYKVNAPYASIAAFGIERLNANGSIDRTFGTSGIAAIQYNQYEEDDPQRVRVAPDGTLFLVGTDHSPDAFLCAFTPNGHPGASSYGTLGAAGQQFTDGSLREVNNPSFDGRVADLAFQADGRPILFSDVYVPTVGQWSYVARVNHDLSLDSSFYTPVTTSSGQGRLEFTAGGTIDPYGRMVVAGVNGGSLDPRYPGTPALSRMYGDAPRASTRLGTDGVLRIAGADGNDTILVTRSGSSVAVQINGYAYGTAAASAVKSIEVYGRDGNDYINVNAGAIPAAIDGGAGNDTVFGGNGPNTLFGGLGDDVLTPGQGPGNNVIGGGGTDAVNYSHYTRGVEVHLDGQQDSGYSGEHDTIASDITIVYGSQFNDVIFGNTYAYGALHSALYGNGGADSLIAGTGGNSLFGGDGNDLLLSRNNVKDVLDGGNGDNTAHIDTGLDSVIRIQHFQP